MFTLTVNFTDTSKPLWILDGQHRLEGMSASKQKDEPIPFVLLYDNVLYGPPFLAEIFTQVTTGATPMEPLHADWMQFAFKLGSYEQESAQKSMRTTICLCTEAILDNESNPFQNKIQFNPYSFHTGYFAFAFTEMEWVKLIADNYYSHSNYLMPEQLAAEIAKAVRAFEQLDQKRNQTSKIFGNSSLQINLAEAFVRALLKYLASVQSQMSLNEWKNFFQSQDRQFQRCKWDLPFVKSSGALSSSNGTPSKIIAQMCFDVAFNDPPTLDGETLTDYLQGVGARFRIFTHTKIPSTGRLSHRNAQMKSVSKSANLVPIDLNANGIRGEIIRIESETPNCFVVEVMDNSVNPPVRLAGATRSSGLDVSSFASGKEILVHCMSYSSDTKIVTTLRLDK